MIGKLLDSLTPRNMKGHAPIVGLTRTAPVEPFKFAPGSIVPGSRLPGNGQH